MIKKLFDKIFPHIHKFQIRGINMYGGGTYRVCLKCRVAQIRVNNLNELDKWEGCDPIKELDDQFDSNDNFIFKS